MVLPWPELRNTPRFHGAGPRVLMLAGDFRTMSLADLLQWVDSARVSCAVIIHHSGTQTSFRVHDRIINAISLPAGTAMTVSIRNPDVPDGDRALRAMAAWGAQ